MCVAQGDRGYVIKRSRALRDRVCARAAVAAAAGPAGPQLHVQDKVCTLERLQAVAAAASLTAAPDSCSSAYWHKCRYHQLQDKQTKNTACEQAHKLQLSVCEWRTRCSNSCSFCRSTMESVWGMPCGSPDASASGVTGASSAAASAAAGAATGSCWSCCCSGASSSAAAAALACCSGFSGDGGASF